MAHRIKDLLAAVRSREPLRRKHHVVPKFYLERFANNGELGVFDKSTGRAWTTGANGVAVIKDFYMVYDEDGNAYDIWERDFLADKVEGPAAAAIAKAAAGQDLSAEERESVAVFVGIQSVRGQAFPQPVETAMVQLFKLQVGQAADLIEQGYEVESVRVAFEDAFGRRPTKEEYRMFPDVVRGAVPDAFEVNRSAMLRHYMEIGLRTADLFLGFEWQVIRFGEPVLITSDEPVWLESAEPTGPYGVGFGNADATWMPLDPKAALRMRRRDLEAIDPSTVDPMWLNQGLTGQAHRFLYGGAETLSALDVEIAEESA